MTISSSLRKAGPFLGNGVTSSFPFTFKCFSTSDIQVIKTSTAGVDQPLILNSDYSVALNADQNASPGGSITFPLSGALLQTGEKLTATGVLAALQGTHITNGGNFFANNIEDQMDYLTILVQQLIEQMGRVALASSSDINPVLTIGTAIQRALTYITFDASGNLALAQALPSATLSQASILGFLAGAGNLLGAITNGITLAETAAGVAVVNSSIPSHEQIGVVIVDRYGTNTTPGTTDMGPAFNAAIKVALSTLGAGSKGAKIVFLANAYSIATVPVFGGATANIIPLDISGQGIGTQIINNLPAGTSALFPMATKNGWHLHDFLMAGNSVHKNDGIQVNTTGGGESIEWRVERVTSLMAGKGIVCADTNTGSIVSFRHWPGNNPALIVAQTVALSDINHGIYLTGSFCHNLTITDPVVNGHSGYGSGAMRGIKLDATFAFGVTINGTVLAQTLSGLNNDISIEIVPGSACSALTLQGLYAEGATVKLSNIDTCVIGPFTNGGVGSALVLSGTCRLNTFLGCSPGIIDITDTSGGSQGNTFIGCFPRGAAPYVGTTAYVVGNYVSSGGVQYRVKAPTTGNAPPNATFYDVVKTTNDGNEGANLSSQPNRFIGSVVAGAFCADLGIKWRQLLAYTASITANVFGPNHNVIRVTNATAFTINPPSNPRNGAEQEFTIRNESGGAMGVITWSGIGVAGWVNPATGFNRSICIYYDSDFSSWRQKWVGTVDVVN